MQFILQLQSYPQCPSQNAVIHQQKDRLVTYLISFPQIRFSSRIHRRIDINELAHWHISLLAYYYLSLPAVVAVAAVVFHSPTVHNTHPSLYSSSESNRDIN